MLINGLRCRAGSQIPSHVFRFRSLALACFGAVLLAHSEVNEYDVYKTILHHTIFVMYLIKYEDDGQYCRRNISTRITFGKSQKYHIG